MLRLVIKAIWDHVLLAHTWLFFQNPCFVCYVGAMMILVCEQHYAASMVNKTIVIVFFFLQ